MTALTLCYATNRNHLGQDRWKPEGYGSKFSQDGVENLRFGRLTLEGDQTVIPQHLNKNMDACGKGEGGAAHPALLHNKVQQIDCTPIVSGLAEHSYYLSGFPNADIRQSINALPQTPRARR